MGTIGEKVIARLDALERTVTNLQTRTSDANTQRPVEMGEMQNEFDELRQQVALVRSQLESMPASSTFGPRPPHNGTFQKEMMPEVLGNAYKEKWRVWSYKTRDWLAQWDDSLRVKLEAIESQGTELTDDQLREYNVSPPSRLGHQKVSRTQAGGGPS